MTALPHSPGPLVERLQSVAALLGTSPTELLDEWESLAPPAGSEHPRSALTEAEEQALAAAGVRPRPVPPLRERASTSTLEQVLRMRLEGFTTREVAGLLGVTEGRVRQRIAADELVAMKGPGGEWRLPRWQFHGPHLLPGLPEVLARIPADWPPVAVERWLLEPADDLAIRGTPASPREWLSAGLDPAPVAELAAQLDMAL